jgi:hypothetical protein
MRRVRAVLLGLAGVTLKDGGI